ncbi:MAG: right-handed parallel beta-helix repeat-containing protein [Candidatus Omnitrophica bacterium]|nr:right-handed parallel beta-helix repeat-containing protein [Candidatus Omnitrophota bacterium]
MKGSRAAHPLFGWPIGTVLSCFAVLYGEMGSVGAATYNVRLDGTGNFTTIQAAINAAVSGDVILVHPGTYVEHINFLGKDLVVQSTNPNDPGVVAGTAIDGQLVPGFALVRFESGEGPNCTLSGLTITRGAGEEGGGISIKSNSSPTISKCVISNNAAYRGAGVFCKDSAPMLTQCTLTGNTSGTFPPQGQVGGAGVWCQYDTFRFPATFPTLQACTISGNVTRGNGGGIAVTGSTERSIAIQGCDIRENQAGSGGGIYLDIAYVTATITNSYLTGNIAGSAGGGICVANLFSGPSNPQVLIRDCLFTSNQVESGNGGGVAGGSYDVRVENCTFVTNRANNAGGGFYGGATIRTCLFSGNQAKEGGGCAFGRFMTGGGHGRVFDCRFAGNQATDPESSGGNGGGVYGPAWLVRCRFIENQATRRGGGYASETGSVEIVNSLFARNFASQKGGAIYVRTALYCGNCTIAQNVAAGGAGGGIACLDGGAFFCSGIFSCILWENGDDLDGCEATYSCIQDGDPGQGNISSDPQFTDPSVNNFCLQLTSPCIDAGAPPGHLPDCGFMTHHDTCFPPGNGYDRNDMGFSGGRYNCGIHCPGGRLPTETATATNTKTHTRTQTHTGTPTPTHTVTGTATNTPTITATFTITDTPTVTATPSTSPTFTPTPSITNTSTTTHTPTPTVTPTPTHTFTITETQTATVTRSHTHSPTASNTPTVTDTGTSTATATPTPTFTVTSTSTNTVTFTPTQNLDLAEAVDNTQPHWVSVGAGEWFLQSTTTHDGNDAAQSGRVGNNQATVLTANLVGAGTLTFWWSVSSEPGFDYLIFSIDGNTMDRISGVDAWRHEVYELQEGNHVVEWIYAKDRSRSQYRDAAWVDQVVWRSDKEPSLNPPRLLEMMRHIRDGDRGYTDLLRRSRSWQGE